MLAEHKNSKNEFEISITSPFESVISIHFICCLVKIKPDLCFILGEFYYYYSQVYFGNLKLRTFLSYCKEMQKSHSNYIFFVLF